MIYSHFYHHDSFCTVFWISSFYVSVNIVLYQFTVTCIENWSVRSLGQWIIESKVYLLSMLERKKKGSCDYVFGSSTKFQRGMTGFVRADICRPVSVCLRVFCEILFALKPFRDYSLCSVCILPQSAFYSPSVVCILHSVCLLPLVLSLQSAVCSLRFTLTDFVSSQIPGHKVIRWMHENLNYNHGSLQQPTTLRTLVGYSNHCELLDTLSDE